MNQHSYDQDIIIKNNSDTLVIIFHGLGSNPMELKELTDHVSKLSFDIYVPLLPYHGQDYIYLSKAKEPLEFYEWGSKLICELKQNYKKLILIGYSFGAGISVHYLSNRGDADAVILLSTGGFFSWGIRFAAFLSKFFGFNYAKTSYTHYYEEGILPLEYIKWKEKNFPKMPLKMLLKASLAIPDYKPKMKKITAPILMLNGSKDAISSKKAIERISISISSKIIVGFKLKGVGHSILKSKKRFHVFEQILLFLSEIMNSGEYKKQKTFYKIRTLV